MLMLCVTTELVLIPTRATPELELGASLEVLNQLQLYWLAVTVCYCVSQFSIATTVTDITNRILRSTLFGQDQLSSSKQGD